MFFMLFFLVKEKIIRIGSKDLEGEYVGGGLRSSERIILYFEIYKIYDIYCRSLTLSAVRTSELQLCPGPLQRSLFFILYPDD